VYRPGKGNPLSLTWSRSRKGGRIIGLQRRNVNTRNGLTKKQLQWTRTKGRLQVKGTLPGKAESEL